MTSSPLEHEPGDELDFIDEIVAQITAEDVEEHLRKVLGTNSAGHSSGPTIQRLVLGSHLHRLRERTGITAEQAAEVIRASHSKISRIEHGRVSVKMRDIADLLTLYGVCDGEERAALLNLARESNRPGWWHTFSDSLPDWFESYVGLEEAASLIRTYEIQFVPGQLQTEGYAHALLRSRYPNLSEEELSWHSGLRTRRQDTLSCPGGPQLWAVVDEGALRRPIGSPVVMREQIQHLITATDDPAVTLQILPYGIGSYPAGGTPFTLLRFPRWDDGDVICIEQLTNVIYLDKPTEVDCYLTALDQLCLQAEPAAETPGLLRQILTQCGTR